jgi:Flp pilus assembly protein TadG
MFSKLVRNFISDESGNYAVIFALSALPLMAGFGASFDYVQASSLESEMSRSIEQAGIAGVQEFIKGKPKSVVEKTVRAMMLANLGLEHKDALKVQMKMPDRKSPQGMVLQVSARLTFKPMMAPLYAAVTGRSADHYDYVIALP